MQLFESYFLNFFGEDIAIDKKKSYYNSLIAFILYYSCQYHTLLHSFMHNIISFQVISHCTTEDRWMMFHSTLVLIKKMNFKNIRMVHQNDIITAI